MLAGLTMIVVVLVAGWIFYGQPDTPSDAPSGSPVSEQGAGKADGGAALTGEAQSAAPGENSHVAAAVESPYLLDHLPFKEEEVEAITADGNGLHQTIPAERHFMLLQSLRLTDMKGALAAQVPESSRKPIVLQFKLADSNYELTYDLGANAYEYQGQYYYADDQVLLLLQGLFRERQELASLDASLEQARVELEQAGTVDPKPLDAELAQVDGLDFAGWEQRLTEAESADIVWEKPFYDDGTGQVRQARLYKDGVLALNRMIVFTRPEHQTAGGVMVGVGLDDVMDKLGPEALKLVSRWSYKVGDYFRFHVYFEGRKVKYVVLSQPL